MVRKICSVVAVLCGVAAVQASNSVHFIGVEHGGADIVQANGINGSFYADTLQFTAQGTDVATYWGTNPTPTFTTVCCDISHDISGGDNYGVTFTDSITYNGNPTLHNGSTIDAVHHAGSIVGYVGDLMAVAHPNDPLSYLDATQGAALQIAVWEVLYDNVAPTTKANFLASLLSGNFALTHSDMSLGINDPLVTDAWNDYLGGYGAGADAIFIQATTHGEHGDKFQDQFAWNPGAHTRVLTPEPITMSLGFAGIGLFAKRRAKSKKA